MPKCIKIDTAKEMYINMVECGFSCVDITNIMKADLNAKYVYIDYPNPCNTSHITRFDAMCKIEITWKNNKSDSFFSTQKPRSIVN